METQATSASGVSALSIAPRRPAVIVDSNRGYIEAAVHPAAPALIQRNQRLVDVTYYSFDGRVHAGQLVIDRRLVADVRQVFELALRLKFPIQSVLPVSAFGWSDDQSMVVNNTSAYNYREKTGGGQLSNHAFGYAIDINPQINPYLKGSVMEPANGSYKPGSPGVLSADHPIVKKFKSLGWEWGGAWTSLKDYQHFEKKLPPEYESYRP